MILRALLALGFVLLASPASAEPVTLSGTEINSALTGKTVEGIHEGATWRQEFGTTGATTYTSRGRTDLGSWQVRGDEYCSQWPPSENWDCYMLTRDGDVITFVPASGGQAWPARFVN